MSYKTRGKRAIQKPTSLAQPATAGQSSFKIQTKGDGVEVTGHDFITSISLTETAAATPIYDEAFGVSTMASSRLVQLAALYEYYHVDQLEFHFQGEVAATVAGSYVAFFDYDPADIESTDYSLENAYGHKVNVSAKYYESAKLVVPPNPHPRQADLFTNVAETGATPDPRLSLYGRLVIVPLNGQAFTENSVAVLTPIMSVYVTYRITLYSSAYHVVTPVAFSESKRFVPYADVFLNESSLAADAIHTLPIKHLTTGTTHVAADDRFSGTAAEVLKTAAALTATAVFAYHSVLKYRPLFRTFTFAGTNSTEYRDYIYLPPGFYRWNVRLNAVLAADNSNGVAQCVQAATPLIGTVYLNFIARRESVQTTLETDVTIVSAGKMPVPNFVNGGAMLFRNVEMTSMFKVNVGVYLSPYLNNMQSGSGTIAAFANNSNTDGLQIHHTISKVTNAVVTDTWTASTYDVVYPNEANKERTIGDVVIPPVLPPEVNEENEGTDDCYARQPPLPSSLVVKAGQSAKVRP